MLYKKNVSHVIFLYQIYSFRIHIRTGMGIIERYHCYRVVKIVESMRFNYPFAKSVEKYTSRAVMSPLFQVEF